jgi:serine/threonine protein phosphatase 1
LYVIGDIHGRLDLLEQLIERINLDIKSREGEAVIVTLGDYVDRGPNSSGVLDRLANNPFEGRYVALKGNHEALLEAFLANPCPLRAFQSGANLDRPFAPAFQSKTRS